MQLVNPQHEHEVGCRHRPGQIIDAPPTDVQRRRLLRDRQIVRTVDHRFALGFAEHPDPGFDAAGRTTDRVTTHLRTGIDRKAARSSTRSSAVILIVSL
jgi:hypothetical protein